MCAFSKMTDHIVMSMMEKRKSEDWHGLVIVILTALHYVRSRIPREKAGSHLSTEDRMTASLRVHVPL